MSGDDLIRSCGGLRLRQNPHSLATLVTKKFNTRPIWLKAVDSDSHFGSQNGAHSWIQMKKPPITLRNNTWYIRRREPKRYSSVEERTMVHLSSHRDSRSIAEGKWRAIWDNQVDAWEAKLAGDAADAVKRHAAAVELAKVKGFRYLPTREVLDLGNEDILARVLQNYHR